MVVGEVVVCVAIREALPRPTSGIAGIDLVIGDVGRISGFEVVDLRAGRVIQVDAVKGGAVVYAKLVRCSAVADCTLRREVVGTGCCVGNLDPLAEIHAGSAEVETGTSDGS